MEIDNPLEATPIQKTPVLAPVVSITKSELETSQVKFIPRSLVNDFSKEKNSIVSPKTIEEIYEN